MVYEALNRGTSMTAVFNNMWVGYAFSQAFDLQAGVVGAGATLVGDVHYRNKTRQASKFRVTLNKSLDTEDRFTLSLSPEQTGLMLAPSEVSVEPVIKQLGASDKPLGVRIIIAVAQSLTDPAGG